MSAPTHSERSSALRLHRIVLIGRAGPDLSMVDVRSLIFETRGFTILNGIGGVLTYDPRGWLLCAEGTSDAIDELLAQARKDHRYGCIRLLHDQWLEAGEFMTFHDVIGLQSMPVSTATLAGLWRVRLTPETARLLDNGYAALAHDAAAAPGAASGR